MDPLCQYLPVSWGATVVFFLLLALLGLRPEMRWGGAAAALPALLVLLQYVYLWAFRPRAVEKAEKEEQRTLDKDEYLHGRERAMTAVESNYGPRTLFIRYGLPAILLLIECVVLVFALVSPEWFFPEGLPRELIHGARYGAAGAYTWVIVELGRRSFRRDVTSGIALWSIVTLALGPSLAGVLSLVWIRNVQATSEWQAAVVFFFTGYAPRTVLSAVSSAATQLLRIGPMPNVETRTTPLTKIRGINPQLEERLGEEGIYNVETLATVEPIRLLRDTSFDLRGILWWVDEALLIQYAPQRWQLLEEHGITGAVDLADLWRSKAWDVIDKLAGAISMDPVILRALAQRVHEDKQVQYISWLYNVYAADGQVVAPQAA